MTTNALVLSYQDDYVLGHHIEKKIITLVKKDTKQERKYRVGCHVDITGITQPIAKGQQDYFRRESIPMETTYASVSEFAGRLCYMSFNRPRPGGTAGYFKRIKEEQHGSVIEHQVVNMIISGVSRSFTHELVRHRAGTAFSQVSQRYVDASNAKFVVPPLHYNEPNKWIMEHHDILEAAMAKYAEQSALANQQIETKKKKAIRESAREILPNCTETQIKFSINGRALRHVFEKRGEGDGKASLEMRYVCHAIYQKLIDCPEVHSSGFINLIDDITFKLDEEWHPYVDIPYKKV